MFAAVVVGDWEREMGMDIRFSLFRNPEQAVRDLRREMLADTTAFLEWALAEERGLPRIPRRRVDEGGFTQLLRQPGARQLVERWWSRALQTVDKE